MKALSFKDKKLFWTLKHLPVVHQRSGTSRSTQGTAVFNSRKDWLKIQLDHAGRSFRAGLHLHKSFSASSVCKYTQEILFWNTVMVLFTKHCLWSPWNALMFHSLQNCLHTGNYSNTDLLLSASHKLGTWYLNSKCSSAALGEKYRMCFQQLFFS